MSALETTLSIEIIAQMREQGCNQIADLLAIYSQDGTELQKKRIADISVILKDIIRNGEVDSRFFGALKQLDNRFRSLPRTTSHWWIDGFISALVITSHQGATGVEVFFRKLMEAISPDKQAWDFGKGIYS